MESQSQGAAANQGGKALERFVEIVTDQYDFLLTPYRENQGNTDLFTKRLLLTNVPYKNMFGSVSRSEFVLINSEVDRSIRIECRWQQENGSTDEKLVSLYLNAVNAMPESEVILLVDGGGARDNVVQTIKDWAKINKFSPKVKTIEVFTMAEFQAWFHRFMKGAA